MQREPYTSIILNSLFIIQLKYCLYWDTYYMYQNSQQ